MHDIKPHGEVIADIRLIKKKDPEVAKDICYKNLICFHAVGKGMARFFEGGPAALFMAYLVGRGGEARKKGTLDFDGYFQCSIDYAEEGSGLSRKKQDSALSILCSLGLVKKKVVGRDTYRWIKLDEVGYELLSEVMKAIPYKYDVTYKTLSKYAHGPITEMLKHGLEKCITNAGMQILANAQNGKSSLSNIDIDESTKQTKNKPIGKEPTWKEPSEDTTTSCRDEGQNPPSSMTSQEANRLAVNQAINATRSTTAIKLPGNTPAYSKKSKPRHKPGPLPAHSAIPFMQDLARTLAPILSNPAHAEYPTEGSLAYKYHLDALDAYDAIQTGAIFARTLDKPERYTSPTAWGNAYRLEQLKLWAKDPKAMEASLLAAARIYASMRSTNMVAAKLPNVAAFLFGSTTAGGFLPWWNHVKPFEEMEAKEQKVLKRVEQDEQSKQFYLTMEEKRLIEQGDFEHKKFVRLFGREPNKFKEIKK